MEQPSYYAVIPAHVRYADISANAKLLFGEITALSSKEGYCWASNKYFGDLYGVGAKTVSDWVAELRDAGFITYTVENLNSRRIFAVGVPLKDGRGYRKKTDIVLQENSTNNIVVAGPPTVDIPIGAEDRPTKVPKAKYPHSKEVFEWFPNPQRSWGYNTTELQHSELLFLRGEKAVKQALAFVRNHEDDENFNYKVIKPSDLERKWEDLKLYAKRNG